ncbi:hypothetical protein AMTRI_Chr07g28740 [Amborella trichopoda]|uniref:uncharacterized protein LOC110006592 n=1 Tax=Amborella trichopoda TaxID=13333 RepID=UPI0009C058BA|nr:uncharacterized protein LOC110006592 [Amborella trichopoda]|eukprot:XP_020518185.1 uncharacterized protein LOC110006592 [Amborella trichopoda]
MLIERAETMGMPTIYEGDSGSGDEHDKIEEESEKPEEERKKTGYLREKIEKETVEIKKKNARRYAEKGKGKAEEIDIAEEKRKMMEEMRYLMVDRHETVDLGVIMVVDGKFEAVVYDEKAPEVTSKVILRTFHTQQIAERAQELSMLNHSDEVLMVLELGHVFREFNGEEEERVWRKMKERETRREREGGEEKVKNDGGVQVLESEKNTGLFQMLKNGLKKILACGSQEEDRLVSTVEEWPPELARFQHQVG